MANKAKIIYLNGTSSCGKSTIAGELRRLLPASTVVSSDAFAEGFEKQFDHDDPVYQRINAHYESCIEQITRAYTAEKRRQAFDKLYRAINDHPLPTSHNSDLAMYQLIKTLAQSEPLIIVDDLISTEFLFKAFLTIFSQQAVTIYLIKIDCTPEVLEERERRRGDRLRGAAVYWHRLAHENKDYDLSVNSAKNLPDICAMQIADFISSHPAPRAFAENVKRYLTGR